MQDLSLFITREASPSNPNSSTLPAECIAWKIFFPPYPHHKRKFVFQLGIIILLFLAFRPKKKKKLSFSRLENQQDSMNEGINR